MIVFNWYNFDSLTTSQLYDILALRQKIFVLEQKCFYNDIDYYDQQAMHLLGVKDKQLIAYLRFLPRGTIYSDEASFGRIITHPDYQKLGLGKRMVKLLLAYFEENYPKDTMLINAQTYLRSFYQSFEFQVVGDEYDDAGVMHVDMRRDAYQKG